MPLDPTEVTAASLNALADVVTILPMTGGPMAPAARCSVTLQLAIGQCLDVPDAVDLVDTTFNISLTGRCLSAPGARSGRGLNPCAMAPSISSCTGHGQLRRSDPAVDRLRETAFCCLQRSTGGHQGPTR